MLLPVQDFFTPSLDRAERSLIDRVVSLRTEHRLKLPDAIIAATAIERAAILITDDQQLRKLSTVKTSGTSTSTP
jgi:predicted nucleic acid-binding protein